VTAVAMHLASVALLALVHLCPALLALLTLPSMLADHGGRADRTRGQHAVAARDWAWISLTPDGARRTPAADGAP
jgi:hypothetical protein